MPPSVFEYTCSGWVYRAKHGHLLITGPDEVVTTLDLIRRADLVDRASKLTETNIADMSR